jgi:8-oxo-dGTP diphosphatase
MPTKRFKLRAAVYLICQQDNEILMLRRFNTGYKDGQYSLPAGHINGNETLTEAVIREADEEINIKIKAKDLNFVHAMHRKSIPTEYLDFFFLINKWNGLPIINEPNKSDQLKWFKIGTLPKNAISEIRHALNCWQKNIYYSEFNWDQK